MEEFLNTNRQGFNRDSVSYYHDSFATDADSLSGSHAPRIFPEAVYGRSSVLMAPVKSEHRLSHLMNIPVWEGWLATGILVIFLLFFRYISIYLRGGISGLLSLRVQQKQFKENSLLMRNIRQVLFLFSLLILSFWIYLLLSQYGGQLTMATWQLYFLVFGGALIYFILKAGVMWLIGTVSDSAEALSMLAYSGQLCVIAAGILLFPLSIMLLLGSERTRYTVNMVIAIVCALSFLLYFIRSFQIFHRAKFSLFFWILYLCTFEIVPFLVLYSCFAAD